MALLSALLLGLVAGSRSMMPLATVTLATHAGRLTLGDTIFSFLRYPISAWVFCLFAAGELIADKLPFVPSRKQVFPFAARIVSGAIAGGAVGVSAGMMTAGILLGAVGAVVGTLGGSAFRSRLASTFGKDLPAALTEDAIVLVLAASAYALMPATRLS